MSKKEIMAEVIEIFRNVFDDTELEIGGNTCADDIEDWDSLEQINLILAMEKNFSVKFNIKEVSRLKNVGEMVNLIQSKCIDNEE